MKNDIIEENLQSNVYVAFKPCGCATGVDLDADVWARIAWKNKGYTVRIMTKEEALNMLRCSCCLHR